VPIAEGARLAVRPEGTTELADAGLRPAPALAGRTVTVERRRAFEVLPAGRVGSLGAGDRSLRHAPVPDEARGGIEVAAAPGEKRRDAGAGRRLVEAEAPGPGGGDLAGGDPTGAHPPAGAEVSRVALGGAAADEGSGRPFESVDGVDQGFGVDGGAAGVRGRTCVGAVVAGVRGRRRGGSGGRAPHG